MSISTVLRQWCPVCARATVTVMCRGHWPDPPVAICKECRSGHLKCPADD